MPPNLRLSLAIFSVGFLAEGLGDLYGFFRPLGAAASQELLLLGPAFTVLGLVFLYVGRHEWSEVHRTRVKHAHRTFFASLVFGALALVPVGLKALEPQAPLPAWAIFEFTLALTAALTLAFSTYLVVVFHLLRSPARAVALLALLSAGVVGLLIAQSLASQLDLIVGAALRRELPSPAQFGGVEALDPYFATTYFLFFAAYVDAHRRVARGLEGEAPAAAPATAG